MGFFDVDNKQELHEQAVAFKEKWTEFDKTEADKLRADIAEAVRPLIEAEVNSEEYSINLKGKTKEEFVEARTKDQNVLGLANVTFDNSNRMIGIIRGWYLLNGMSFEDMVSDDPEKEERRRALNKEFAESYYVPAINTYSQEEYENLTAEEKQAHERRKAEVSSAMDRGFLNTFKINEKLGDIKFEPFNLDENFDGKKFFEEAEKLVVYDKIPIDVNHIFANYKSNVYGTDSSAVFRILGSLEFNQVSANYHYSIAASSLNYPRSAALSIMATDEYVNAADDKSLTGENVGRYKKISLYNQNSKNLDFDSLNGKAFKDIPLKTRDSLLKTVGMADEAEEEVKDYKTVDVSFNMKSPVDLIKNVSGIEFDENNPDMVQDALSHIVISGKTLKGSVEDAAKAIKAAFDFESNDYVAVINQQGKLEIKEPPYAFAAYKRIIDLKKYSVDDYYNNKVNRDKESLKSLTAGMDSIGQNAAAIDAKLLEEQDNTKFLSALTGSEINVEDKTALRKAMDTIYVDGHSLVDKLGVEPDAAGLNTLVESIKESLDVKNMSAVCIMKPNSVEPEPRPVIFKDSNDKDVLRKNNAALYFAASHRLNVHNAAKDVLAETDRIIRKDDELFFSFLNSNDEAGKSFEEREKTRNDAFGGRGIYFTTLFRRSSRVSLGHAMLLGKGYSMEDILSDKPEIIEAKKEVGKELFEMTKWPVKMGGIKNIDNFAQMNAKAEKAYEMYSNAINAFAVQKPTYYDMSDPDEIRKNYTKSRIFYQMSMDLLQSVTETDAAPVQKLTNMARNLGGSLSATAYLFRSINDRVGYLAGDGYTSKTVKAGDSKAAASLNTQLLLDSMENQKAFFSSSLGSRSANDMAVLDSNLRRGNYKNNSEDIAKRVEEGKGVLSDQKLNKETMDLLSKLEKENIENSNLDKTGVMIKAADNISKRAVIESIRKPLVMEPGGKELTKDGYTVSKDLQNRFGGLDFISIYGGLAVDQNSDTKLIKEVADKIYINGIPASQYYSADENTPVNCWVEIGNQLSDIIKNPNDRKNNNVFLMVKNDENKFVPILIGEDLSTPPTKVEKLSLFGKIGKSKEEIDKNEKDYNAYVAKQAEFDSKVKYYSSFKDYNKTAIVCVETLNKSLSMERAHNERVRRTSLTSLEGAKGEDKQKIGTTKPVAKVKEAAKEEISVNTK